MVLEFKDVGNGWWIICVEIVDFRGVMMMVDSMLLLDGMFGLIIGNYGVDVVLLSMLVLNVLVM